MFYMNYWKFFNNLIFTRLLEITYIEYNSAIGIAIALR